MTYINSLWDFTFDIKYNEYINQEYIENVDINSLIIDSASLNLKVIKILNDKNFNFNLLKFEDVIFNLNDEESIIYMIQNNLYNFLDKDIVKVVIFCDINVFKFWINYLNINVYKDYNGHSLYYYINKILQYDIFCDKNFVHPDFVIGKLNYIYDTYNLKLKTEVNI